MAAGTTPGNKMNFASKNLWLILEVLILTLSMGAYASEFNTQADLCEPSMQKATGSVGAQASHSASTGPTVLSLVRKYEFVGFLRTSSFGFKFPAELHELLKASDAEILEILAIAQHFVDDPDQKRMMKIQIWIACLAAGKLECFQRLDAEINMDTKFLACKCLYTQFATDMFFSIPYARIEAPQEFILNSFMNKSLYPSCHLSDAIAFLNASQLRYLIKYFEENNVDTFRISYEGILKNVSENYKFLLVSEEEIKDAVKLIKSIRGFDLRKLISFINAKLSNNTGPNAYSPEKIAGLIAYKDALIKYWDLK